MTVFIYFKKKIFNHLDRIMFKTPSFLQFFLHLDNGSIYRIVFLYLLDVGLLDSLHP